MGSEPSTSDGKIRVDEHYPSELDEPPPFDIKKIENIRSNVKFEHCYEIAKHIGDGKFGKVFQVKEKSTGREFAAKFIKIRKEADRQEVEREVSILTHLRHPRIAQIYDAFYTTTNDVVLIMEVVRGGELFDRVADENYVLTEQAVVMIICQLCEAIEYIHQQNILHLDIKPENIMCVSQTGNRIKLIDFGLARHYDGTQELKYMAGTPEFAAPEVIKFEKLDYHTDMWSVGVITYILLSGYSPFLGDNLGETYCNVEKGVWEFTEEFDAVSDPAKDFISKLLIYDQRKRMLPAECLTHPWIAKQRSKVQCDVALEKPGEGPKIDNKMMMRYNAKRKFRPEIEQKLRRMIIYVKFLIEMNRLRNSLRDRMSEHGQKFFDPLLKMAEEKERRVALICPQVQKKKDITSVVEKLTSDVVEKEKKSKKTSESEQVENGKTPSIFKKKPVDDVLKVEKKEKLSSAVESKAAVAMVVDDMVKKVTPDGIEKKRTSVKILENGEVVKVMKKRSIKRETPQHSEEPLEIKKVPATTDVVVSEKKLKLKKEGDLMSLPPTPKKALAPIEVKKSVIPELPKTEPPKKLSISSLFSRSPLSTTTMESFKKTSLPTDLVLSTEKKNSISSVESKSSSENKTDGIKIKKSIKKVESTDVLNEAPKKTVLLPSKTTLTDVVPERSDVIKEKKAQKTESSDSTKENRIDEKKPSRQGALRKKDRSTENLTHVTSITGKEETGLRVERKSVDSENNNITTDKIIVKRKSTTSVDGEKPKTATSVLDNTKISSSRSGSLVQARLMKLNSSDPPLSVSIVSVPTIKKQESKPLILSVSQVAEEPKKSKMLIVTTEKKTTTTTATTTSVKRKTATSEKKVHHNWDGKTIEHVEKKSSQLDNVKVSQVTTKREESPELATPVTSVKKNVVKQDTLKTTTEKNRREEEKGKDSSLVKTSKSIQDQNVDKITLEEKTKSTNGITKQLSVSGTKDVTRKLEGSSEVEFSPRKTSLKKADLTLTERTRSILEAHKDDQRSRVEKKCTTVITITPDCSGSETGSVKSALGSTLKKSSISLEVPKKTISRDNSEERKKVRFAGDVKEPVKTNFGLQKVNSESCLLAKVEAHTKIEIKKSKDDGEIKKKSKLLASKSEDVSHYIPRDEFSFDNLKEQLMRRVSIGEAPKEGKKECVPIIKTSSVKDRLRQFEKK